MYQSERGADGCENCTKGKFTDETRSTSCQECPKAFFAPYVAATSCLKCSSETSANGEWSYGPRYTATTGSSRCDRCVVGYYMDDSVDEPTCQPCDDGMDCSEEGTELTSMEVIPGYYRFSKTSTVTYPCLYENNCPGGNGSLEALCLEGSSGPTCRTCDSGEIRCKMPPSTIQSLRSAEKALALAHLTTSHGPFDPTNLYQATSSAT